MAQISKWGGDQLPLLHALFPLHFDADILTALRYQKPAYIIVLASTHEPNLIHNLKVLAMHAGCIQLVVGSLVLPDTEKELQDYTALLATELQPVLVDFYPIQMSALELISTDEKVCTVSRNTCHDTHSRIVKLIGCGLFADRRIVPSNVPHLPSHLPAISS